MSAVDIVEFDKTLEIALLIRAGETGYLRDHRSGPIFGYEGDIRRLDAFTFGLLEALAGRISARRDWTSLLIYMYQLNENGPGEVARRSYSEMCELKTVQELARYVGAGRNHIRRALAGDQPDVGQFARLLSAERDGF